MSTLVHKLQRTLSKCSLECTRNIDDDDDGDDDGDDDDDEEPSP